MRSKTLKDIFDDLFWYSLYMLPLICLCFVVCRTGEFIGLSTALTSLGLGLLVDNPILSTISQIFGSGGILPFFVSSDILVYVSYFICVFIVHLLVDFVLFIPRLCHKWTKKLYQGD